MYVNNQRIYNSNGLYALKSYLSNKINEAISEYKGSCIAKDTTRKNFLTTILEAPLFEPFFTRRKKKLSKPDGLMLYGKLGIDFFSTSELLYPKKILGYDLSEPNLSFTSLTTTPSLVTELLIAHCTLLVLLSRMIITRNEWPCLHMLLWSSFNWRLQQRLLSFPLD